MRATDVSETVNDMRADVVDSLVMRRVPEKAFAEQWELKELAEDVRRVLNLDLPIEEWGREEGIDESGLRERVEKAADAQMTAKAASMGDELMRFIEKSLLIQTLDAVWKEHLYALDHLRQGIGLRAYGQRDPLNEYKTEAFALFNAMLDELKERVTAMLARVELAPEPVRPPPPVQTVEFHPQPVPAFAGEPEMALEGAAAAPVAVAAAPIRSGAVDPNDPATWRHTSRNAPCPCGSGKKYKHCHGRLN
jgi:preprotein translocase subunit SecA